MVNKFINKFSKQFRYGEKGFTLIELLVVITILGAIAAVVVPNVVKFIGRGETESYAAELHNIQTATMAMLANSTARELDSTHTDISDMDLVTATGSDNTTLLLSSYLTGLNSDGTVSTGATYSFAIKGIVSQSTP